MFRYALVLITLAFFHETSIGSAAAQDNPGVRALVCEAIKNELSTRHCQESGWQSGNTVMWLIDPSTKLAVDVTSFTYEEGRLAIEGSGSALLGFNHTVNTLIGSRDFAGQTIVYVSLKASSRTGEQLTCSKVNIDRLEIDELHLDCYLARPFQGIIQWGVNLYLSHKKADIERRLEESLNGACMPIRLR